MAIEGIEIGVVAKLKHFLVAGLLIGSALLSVASAQSSSPKPSVKEMEDFRGAMLRIPLTEKGCFAAAFPNQVWIPTHCAAPPDKPFLPSKVGARRPLNIGGGTGYFVHVTGGDISTAVGSFDSATTPYEQGPTSTTPNVAHPNIFSLQLNTNAISSTPACGSFPNCMVWQQFIYSQSICNNSTTPCAIIQYWLLNVPSSACPAGWQYSPPSSHSYGGCFTSVGGAQPQQKPVIADLPSIALSGTVSGNADTLLFTDPNGSILAVNSPNPLMHVSQGWTDAEFNVFGDCCEQEAFFDPGSSLKVRLQVTNGTTNVPACNYSTIANSIATAEKNNLNIDQGSCTPIGGVKPAIVFTESGGAGLPPGIIRGDTHVTTVLGGVHYDLQAFGDFLAFESKALGTSFRVITRQKPLNGNNSVAFTTAVAMQMGQTNVAVCLPSQLVIDDEERDLSSGNSIVTRGGVLVSRQNNRYMVYGKSGEIVQIDVSAYIDIALYLPYEERDKSGGILSSMEGNYLQASDGTKYAGPVKWTDFKNFARSWPSVGKQPAACGVSAMQQSFPERPVYADDLGADAARSARARCAASGVKDSALADDCALDTIILNDPSAAAGFINDPSPKTVIKIIP